MGPINVLVLVGGISRNSLNRKYFRAIESLNLNEFKFNQFDITRLPFFSQDIEMDPPDNVTEYKDKIRNNQALLIITPEYNRSFPGVLKNAIDWGSRPYGQNLWDKKPAAILGASSGNIGTFGAQHHLRQILSYLNMHVLGQPEVYLNGSRSLNEEGLFNDENSKQHLRKYFEEFYNLINLVQGSNESLPSSIKPQNSKETPLTH